MNDVIELLKRHVSVRKYKDKPVDDELLKEIIMAGQCASTSSHIQAYTIIRVNEKNKRKELARLAGNQSYVEECPVFLVFCADLNRLERACIMNNEKMAEGYTEGFILATVDTALAAQNVMAAAEAYGMGGVYIGGLRNNPDGVSDVLKLPDKVYPVFGMCLGYPDERNDIKTRLPLELVLKEDTYNTDNDEEKLKEYDRFISNYYKERTNGLRDNTWTAIMADKFRMPQRPHMREFLRSKGFDMK